ncbi:hypothetical protein CTI12_AA426800 [Artemisia annua]|uniref:Retrotransposon gag domain-containing protein n=1 Tax=Artemisia annua TaxID=35608 RepID=A0A2U1M2D4_ARTAN|nr:hypothetical protein CTI12_AA426800 [Artemisia annua]
MIDFLPSYPHDPRTMEDFYRPTLINRGGPITPSSVSGTDFTLKNHMVRLIRQNCQFHGFRDEDANEHLNKYLAITQSMKQNGVSLDSIRLNLFPFSLSHDAENWFYTLKTHSINSWEEMFVKFLSKYFPRSKMIQLRRDILNFRQLPMESLFEAWERFKSLLRKCPDHNILLLDQILTFYNGITPSDRDKIMLAAGGAFRRKTPQEAYDLIKNMTLHHYQWDTEILTFYNGITPIDQDKIMLAAGGAFMRKIPQEAYDLIENMTLHHYQWDTEVQYDSPIMMSDHYFERVSVENKQTEVLNYITHNHQLGPGLPLTNDYSYSDDSESDEDEPCEIKNYEIKESPDTLSMGDKEVEIHPLENTDNLVPIPRVSEKPFDTISEKFNTTIMNPLFDFDPEFALISDNQIFDIYKESDESDTENDMDEVHIDSTQSTAQVQPPYIIPDPIDILHNSESLHEEFSYKLTHIDPIPPKDKDNEDDSISNYTSSLGEFSGELSHITAPPERDNLYYLEGNIDPGEGILYHDITLTNPPEDFGANNHKSLNDDIQIKENVKFAFKDEDLCLIVIKIFLLFFTFALTYPLLHSIRSEDFIFDPGIFAFHAVLRKISELDHFSLRKTPKMLTFVIFLKIPKMRKKRLGVKSKPKNIQNLDSNRPPKNVHFFLINVDLILEGSGSRGED